MWIQEIHRIFCDTIQEFHPHDSYIHLFRAILEKNSKKLSILESVNQRRIIERIEEIQNYMGSARVLLLSKDIDAKEYFKIKSDCEAKIDILKNKINNAATSLIKYKEMLSLMTPFLSTLDLLFDKCDIHEKQKLIMLLYGRRIVWKESCFMDCLNDVARIIYNDEINKKQLLTEDSVVYNLEVLSIDCKKIFEIEYKKGYILSPIQSQDIANLLYDIAKIVIGLFIPKWQYEFSD